MGEQFQARLKTATARFSKIQVDIETIDDSITVQIEAIEQDKKFKLEESNEVIKELLIKIVDTREEVKLVYEEAKEERKIELVRQNQYIKNSVTVRDRKKLDACFSHKKVVERECVSCDSDPTLN